MPQMRDPKTGRYTSAGGTSGAKAALGKAKAVGSGISAKQIAENKAKIESRRKADAAERAKADDDTILFGVSMRHDVVLTKNGKYSTTSYGNEYDYATGKQGWKDVGSVAEEAKSRGIPLDFDGSTKQAEAIKATIKAKRAQNKQFSSDFEKQMGASWKVDKYEGTTSMEVDLGGKTKAGVHIQPKMGTFGPVYETTYTYSDGVSRKESFDSTDAAKLAAKGFLTREKEYMKNNQNSGQKALRKAKAQGRK